MVANAQLYEHFSGAERVTLLLEARAREDEAEAERLSGSCPKRTYTQRDAAFQDRMEMVFDTMAVVCIDLRGLRGKLDILEWTMNEVRHMAMWHHITATMAFLEGTRCGEGQSQMEFFQRLPAQHAAETSDDVVEPSVPDEPDDVEHRLSPLFDGDLGQRMAAVERHAEHGTDNTFVVLRYTCQELARELANTWEAFSRFCRDRVGVSPETMLDAWGFPVAKDFIVMLKRYEHVKADPAKVDEYFGLITANWDKRFGGSL